MAETLDLVVTNKTVGSIETNIAALEALVTKRLEDYRPENYLGDADLAKKDRAELNKARDKIKKARIELIGELMKPYNDFEARCKALEKMIDTASSALDEIVKTKENEEKEKKREYIEQLWNSYNFNLFPLNKIFNSKWLNKTFKEADIQAEIEAVIERTYKDLKTIERYNGDTDPLKAHYLICLDIGETLDYGEELKKKRELVRKEAEERAEREHAEKIAEQEKELPDVNEFQNMQEMQSLADIALGGDGKPERKEFVISVKCFDEELLELKAAMNQLGIEFSVEELVF